MKMMVKEFMCCGCVSGSDPDTCPAFRKGETFDGGHSVYRCEKWCAGTRTPYGKIAIGLPKGFNKIGMADNDMNEWYIRLHTELPPADFWDMFNFPIWAMEHDGYLFVRTYLPRRNVAYLDIIRGGTLSLVPNAVDVSKFIDRID